MKRNKANASSSRGGNGGEGRAEDPYCAVCMSDEFYEDEQGGMICVACGTQSQDFLAEGFDEDDLAVYGGGTGNIVTLKNAPGKGLRAEEENKIRKVNLVPDVLEALKLYQFVLQMMFDACLVASNANSINMSPNDLSSINNAYRSTLKAIWMDYLNRWNTDQKYEPPPTMFTDSRNDKRARFKQPSRCSLGAGFTRSAKFQCTCRDVGSIYSHPLFPSKPLLLGFIYLTYRIMRSDVLVSDIVRWCEAGLVPYVNLWENIPSRWRDTVKVDMKWFYDTTGNRRASVSPSSVLFHACSIAQVIRVEPNPVIHSQHSLLHTNSNNTNTHAASYSSYRAEMPPLNAPLVAHKLFTSLGLPSTVWDNYVKICQVFTSAVPIDGAHMLEQHHELHIMAVLVVAVKFSPRWTEWSLVSDSVANSNTSTNSMGTEYNTFTHKSNTTHMPECPSDLHSLTRSQLPLLLAQIRRINQLHTLHTDTHKTQFPHNNAVFAALGGDVERSGKGEGQFAAEDVHAASQSQYSATPHKTSQSSSHTPYSPYHATPHPHRAAHTAEVPAWSNVTAVDHTSRVSSVVRGACMVTEDMSLRDIRRLNYMNGIEPTNTISTEVRAVNHNKSVYMAYTRYDTDRTSVHHLPYIVLLERCAKYLYVNPQLLHELVTNLEKQIVSLAFTGSTRAQTFKKNGSTRKRNRNKKGPTTSIRIIDTINDISAIKQQLHGAKQRDMHIYRVKSDHALPQLQQQGLNRLISDKRIKTEPGTENKNKKRRTSATSAQIKIEGTHYSEGAQYTQSADEHESDSSSTSDSNERNNNTSLNATTAKNTHIIQKRFVFNPSADCMDIESVFGGTGVIHRTDDTHKRKRQKKKVETAAADSAEATIINTNLNSNITEKGESEFENTPKTSKYTQYDTSATSGDSETEREGRSRDPSPQVLEFDLLHDYNTAQAGQSTPPISELTYSRTPFSAFNSARGVSLVERVHRRPTTPHVAAMEALDRLVSAQDSDSSDSSVVGGADDSSESSIAGLSDEGGGSAVEAIPPLTQPRSRNTVSNGRGVASNSADITSRYANPVPGHIFTMSNTPVLPLPSSAAVNGSTSSTGGISLLARAIYGTPANSQQSAASTVKNSIVAGKPSNVALRPVVALKRPRHSVQFESK